MRKIALLWPLVVLLFNPNLQAADFPERRESGGQSFVKLGEAELHWLFFKVYEGACYIGENASKEDVLEGAPLELEFVYNVEIEAEKLVRSGNEFLKKNTTPEQLARIQPQVDKINAAYQTVRKGDRYRLTYIPGQGTALALNGEPLVTLEGEAFARYYFRIWLGEEPVDADFRDALLGR